MDLSDEQKLADSAGEASSTPPGSPPEYPAPEPAAHEPDALPPPADDATASRLSDGFYDDPSIRYGDTDDQGQSDADREVGEAYAAPASQEPETAMAQEAQAPQELEVAQQADQVQEPAPPAQTAKAGTRPFERRRHAGRRWADNVRRLASICAGVAGLLVMIFILRYLSWVLLPLALAFGIAYLLNPVANALHRATKQRGMAVLLTVIVLVFTLGLFCWQVVPVMGKQTQTFVNNLNDMWLEVQKSIAIHKLDRKYFPDSLDDAVAMTEEARLATRTEVGWQEFLTAWGDYLKNRQVGQAQAIADLRTSTAGTYIGAVFDNTIVFVRNRPFQGMIDRALESAMISATQAAITVVSALFVFGVIIVGLLYLILLLGDFPEYTKVCQTFLPENSRAFVSALGVEFREVMNQYFVRQALAALLTAALFILGFTYAGLPLAIPFGLFVGVLSMIPYLQLAAIAPAILLGATYAIQSRVPFTPLLMGIVATFAVIQLIQEFVIKTYIVGRGRGFERMGILLGAFLWPQLLSWLGFAIAIPATCLIIAWYRLKAKQAVPEAPALVPGR